MRRRGPAGLKGIVEAFEMFSGSSLDGIGFRVGLFGLIVGDIVLSAGDDVGWIGVGEDLECGVGLLFYLCIFRIFV